MNKSKISLSFTTRVIQSHGFTSVESEQLIKLLVRVFEEDAQNTSTARVLKNIKQSEPESVHVVLIQEERFIGHAALFQRRIRIGDRCHVVGYIEDVAIDPDYQDRGLGSQVMREVCVQAKGNFAFLSTFRFAFYARLGWITWQGPASHRVDTEKYDDPEEYADPEEHLMVLPLSNWARNHVAELIHLPIMSENGPW